MTPPRNIRMLLASARIANLPSVIGNTWLGVALAAWTCTFFARPFPVEVSAAWLLPAGIALYLGGNFLNDWRDREWDARHRPERALPQGAFMPGAYLSAGLALLTAGVVCAFSFQWESGIVAGLIALCITGYTIWHKHHPASVALVGLCRALLPLMALAGPMTDLLYRDLGPAGFWLAVPSLALFCHVAGLSARARHEATGMGTGGLAFAIVTLSAAGPLMLAAANMTVPGIAHTLLLPALGVWVLWTTVALTRFRRAPGRQVAALLAGIPLLDWIVLLPLGDTCLSLAFLEPLVAIRPPGATADVILNFAALETVGVVSLLLPPLAFLAGLALQRLAPAT